MFSSTTIAEDDTVGFDGERGLATGSRCRCFAAILAGAF